eukprot:25628-Pelagococcus_subviridis.AAC.1
MQTQQVVLVHEVPRGEEQRPGDEEHGRERGVRQRAREDGDVERVLAGEVERGADFFGRGPTRERRGRQANVVQSPVSTCPPRRDRVRRRGRERGVVEVLVVVRVLDEGGAGGREQREEVAGGASRAAAAAAAAASRRRLRGFLLHPAPDPREQRQELPRRTDRAARAQKREHAHRARGDERVAQEFEKLKLARVRALPPPTLPHLLRRRAQRGFPEREKQQQVDEEEPKLFEHERAERARARQVLLRRGRSLQHVRYQDVNHQKHAKLREKLRVVPYEAMAGWC